MSVTGKIISKSNAYLEWSAIRYPMKGEKVSGDDYLIKKHKNLALVAAVDGLGHGQAALHATRKALDSLKLFEKHSLIYLMNTCHKELNGTRGVVMSMAIFDSLENSMAWIGVGNVEGILFRAHSEEQKEETIILRGGVVGYKLPPLKASIVSILPGDTLIFTTDGVSYKYADKINVNRPTKEIVQYIASNYVDLSDDAQILVARYKGA